MPYTNLFTINTATKLQPILGTSISGTKCARDKLIFSAVIGDQSNRVDVYNTDPIELNIPKTGVITAEPPYNA